MNHGRGKLDWVEPLWHRIDEAVHEEAVRAEIASKFLPIRGPFPDALTVPADTIDAQSMTIPEGLTTPLIELWVEFALTAQQADGEERLATAVTLATRAANLLSRAEDLLIFQGDDGMKNELFKTVHQRAGPAGTGLLKAAGKQVVDVTPTDHKPRRYGEQTFEGVVRAYSLLQKIGHYGPYALVLHSDIYADTYAPLANTLIMPADRIKPLVSGNYFGTGTLPESTGLLVSLGGSPIDIVLGIDPTTAFQQLDNDGVLHFRVFERYALRIKDPTAIVRLTFKA